MVCNHCTESYLLLKSAYNDCQTLITCVFQKRTNSLLQNIIQTRKVAFYSRLFLADEGSDLRTVCLHNV